MISVTKSTPFETRGATFELVSFDAYPDNVYVRMITPGDELLFDGKLRPVKVKLSRDHEYPCFYMKNTGDKSETICIPIKEWREHNGYV